MKKVWSVLLVILLVLGGLTGVTSFAGTLENEPEGESNPVFIVSSVSNIILGWGWTPDSVITININNNEWELSTCSNEWGDFQESGIDFDIKVGHVITVTDGVNTKIHEVKYLEITEINTTHHFISGKADPGSQVWVEIYENWETVVGRSVAADQNGIWIADFSVAAEDDPWGGCYLLAPNVHGAVHLRDEDDDATYEGWTIPTPPSINVMPQDNLIFGGQWLPNATLTITIGDLDNPDYVDYTLTDEYGSYNTEINFDIQGGQVITVTDGETTDSHTVSTVTITEVNLGAQTVSGTAPPNSSFEVGLFLGFGDYGPEWNFVPTVTADAAGDWTADFAAAAITIEPGSQINALHTCGNHVTIVYWRVPFNITSTVTLTHGGSVNGHGWPANTDVTLEITRDSSIVFESVGRSDEDGELFIYTYFEYEGKLFEIQHEDVVTLKASDDVSTTYTVQYIEVNGAYVNQDTFFVYGFAEANKDVEVILSFYDWEKEQSIEGPKVTAHSNEAGYWIAEFTPIPDFQIYNGGHAVISDESGNKTRFALPPLPLNPVFVVFYADPTPVNSGVTLYADIIEPGAGDLAFEYSVDGGNTWVNFTPGEPTAIMRVVASVFEVQCRAQDRIGDESADTLLIAIYDPEGGFVSGSGWTMSPQGAYLDNPDLTDRATFGFTSRYQKGAGVPTGNTQFVFRAGDLSFKSTSYDWLVISGARAQYKGEGAINEISGYGFMLTAIDGDVIGGGGMDKLRIKIWDIATGIIVYDNQDGDSDSAEPATGIGGGSIKIHK